MSEQNSGAQWCEGDRTAANVTLWKRSPRSPMCLAGQSLAGGVPRGAAGLKGAPEPSATTSTGLCRPRPGTAHRVWVTWAPAPRLGAVGEEVAGPRLGDAKAHLSPRGDTASPNAQLSIS